jgi:hypothetical protein
VLSGDGIAINAPGIDDSPASKYVRDNVTDDGGHTPDSLL